MPDAPILIAEDDAQLAAGVATVLHAEGWPVETVARGDEVVAAVLRLRPRLLILDVMMPGLDGFTVLRTLRGQGHDLPVLMLTAKSQEADKVGGFDLGTDDYLTKPFGIRELVARVRSLLRRVAPATPAQDRIDLVGLAIDLAHQHLEAGGRSAELSTHETAILRALAAALGDPVPRKRLVREVWGDAPVTDRAVDFHIANLRKKITAVTGEDEPARLLTVHGSGYRLVR